MTVLDTFLAFASRQREPIVLFLVTGTKIIGSVIDHDDSGVAVSRIERGALSVTIISRSTITSYSFESSSATARYWQAGGQPVAAPGGGR